MKRDYIAKVKNISLNKEKREIIVTVGAKGSMYIKEPTEYGFPYVTNSSPLSEGINYVLEFGNNAINAMKSNSDFKALVEENRELRCDITGSTLAMRVKQFLTSLDYGILTDFQAKCALLLERELK